MRAYDQVDIAALVDRNVGRPHVLAERSSASARRFALGLGLAALVHVGALAAASRPRAHPLDGARPAAAVEVELPAPKPAEKPAEPPQSAPAPAPVGKAPARADDDPRAHPLPAPAPKVIVADPQQDAPVELPTIVTGDGPALGGMESAKGTGDDTTKDRRATVDGKPGPDRAALGAPAAPPPPAEDRSRPIGLVGGSSWSCPFPPEADADQIDSAVVGVQVSVRPDGGAVSATILTDPGHGFARAARACALARRYQAARDRTGAPVAATSLVNVRFER
jgi:protein TonB